MLGRRSSQGYNGRFISSYLPEEFQLETLRGNLCPVFVDSKLLCV
jgi:hypothetical protein